MKKWFINGLVFYQEDIRTVDFAVEDGIITDIAATPIDSEVLQLADEVVDLAGFVVLPGFIDVHVHLREPGFEYKETIQSGTAAAAKGGMTQICIMPNTQPVIDNIEKLSNLKKKIAMDAKIKVHPYGAITSGLHSEELVDMQGLAQHGIFAFTNDGVGVQDADVMYRAMVEAKKRNKPIVAHCEDNSLIYDGCVHDGKIATRLGLVGIPSICESVQIARDVLLAEATGCHYHVCHVSTKESVRIIRDAKAAGITVTCEVTPHHLLLNEDDILNDDANYKMNPPLRSKADQEALITGLLDGTIDMIATDHAPHHPDEKSQSMRDAPFGIIGLEDAFSLLYTKLVQEKKLCSLKQIIHWMSSNPAKIFHVSGGKIEIGYPADFSCWDLEKVRCIPDCFVSASQNSPFIGWDVLAENNRTFVDGELVYKKEEE